MNRFSLTITDYKLIKKKNYKECYKIKLYITYTTSYPNIKSLIYCGTGIDENNLNMNEKVEKKLKEELNKLLGYGPYNEKEVHEKLKDHPVIHLEI